MKSPKEIITDSEYQFVLKRLEFINHERELLKTLNKQNNYSAHIELPNSFEELIIALKREIQETESYINYEKKMFLSQFSFSRDLYLKVESKIEQLIVHNLNEQSSSKKKNLDSVLRAILVDYPGLEEFLEKIVDLTSKLANALFLLEYFKELQAEQIELVRKKYLYEKQQRKASNKVRIRAIKRFIFRNRT